MNNLEIYEKGRAVPLEAQKQYSNGTFSGTDINPMWRIKKLTELFGPAGIGWYYEVISERSEQHGSVTMAIVDLNLYVKYEGEWSKPIFGTGGNQLVTPKGRVSDEGYKMALTDALSIACKALGIGADIWFSKDVTKYTNPNTDDLPFRGDTNTTRSTATPVSTSSAAGAAPSPRGEGFVCARCGKVIEDYENDGVTVTAAQHAKRSQKVFGEVLCLGCIHEKSGK